MSKDTSLPAFPSQRRDQNGLTWNEGYDGLTKREYFAVMALVGMGQWTPMTPQALQNATGTEQIASRAQWAVRHADALLAALKAGDAEE